MKYPRSRKSIQEAVLDAAYKAKYYSGFDETGVAYFDKFCKEMAKFIANNYRRRER